MADGARLLELMREIADELGVELTDQGEGEYVIEYPIEEAEDLEEAEDAELADAEADEAEAAAEAAADKRRTQLVGAFTDDDEDGDTWVMVYSVFGQRDKLDPWDLLARNFDVGLPYIAVGEEDVMVCASVRLDGLDADALEDVMSEVAYWADSLEDELVGGDAF